MRLAQVENKLAAEDAGLVSLRQDNISLNAAVKSLQEAPARSQASIRIWVASIGVAVTLIACASNVFFATISIAVSLLLHFSK
jgi:hypothetical protein